MKLAHADCEAGGGFVVRKQEREARVGKLRTKKAILAPFSSSSSSLRMG